MYQELEGVDEVIVQNTIMYDDVIKKLKPDYVVHGDNWREGAESVIRENVLSLFIRIWRRTYRSSIYIQ